MLVNVLLIFGFIYIVLLVCSNSIANKLIFPKIPASYQDDSDTLKLETSKGAKITAIYLKAPSSKQLLLYSHGNGEDLGMIQGTLKNFQEMGISVLAYDYPGYGTSSNKPTESGVYAAADAAYQLATETLNFAPEQIVLYGYSLGSGPACWLAERYPVHRLILESAFTSAFRVMTRIKLFPNDQFDNFSRLKNISCPILLIHGTKDQIVPFWHAKKNWKVLRGKKEMFWVEDAGHNNLPEITGPHYWETVESFIRKTHGFGQKSG